MSKMGKVVCAPRELVERKPPHGAPCNRCGLCCFMSTCELGALLFGRAEGPCPALLVDDVTGLSACGVVTSPSLTEAARAAAKMIIWAGLGCDARISGEPVNHAFNEAMAENDVAKADEIAAARKMWKLPPKD